MVGNEGATERGRLKQCEGKHGVAKIFAKASRRALGKPVLLFWAAGSHSNSSGADYGLRTHTHTHTHTQLKLKNMCTQTNNCTNKQSMDQSKTTCAPTEVSNAHSQVFVQPPNITCHPLGQGASTGNFMSNVRVTCVGQQHVSGLWLTEATTMTTLTPLIPRMRKHRD